MALHTHRDSNGEKRFYKLRNIWRSETPWDGEYRDNFPAWSEQLRAELGLGTEIEEGCDYIWMTETEFVRSFASLTICMVREDDEILRLKGEFLKGTGRDEQRVVERSVRSKY